MKQSISKPPETFSPHSFGNKLSRLLWGFVYVLAFRWTPRCMHGWRNFLLRLFGAKIHRTSRVYPKARVWLPGNLLGNGQSVRVPLWSDTRLGKCCVHAHSQANHYWRAGLDCRRCVCCTRSHHRGRDGCGRPFIGVQRSSTVADLHRKPRPTDQSPRRQRRRLSRVRRLTQK